jgi:hypothetical protein
MTPTLTFVPGRPPGACRPYTAAERAAMLSSTLAHVPPAAPHERPHAVFVSGLPGCGKSSLAARLAAAALLLPAPHAHAPPPQLALLDADVLRGFHAQTAALLRDPSGVRYTELVPWWLEGSGFEQAVFRDEDGLARTLLATRRSFVQVAVMHTDAYVRWARHVVARGYTAHLLCVHAPAGAAAARARARAQRTGRWCDEEYVRGCERGLLRAAPELGRVCAASGSTVRLLDNAAEAAAEGPDAAALLAAPLRHSVADAYGLHAAALSPERVRAFAAAQMARLPAGTLDGVSCCFAGGAFKCLLNIDDDDGDAASSSSWASMQPRDLDIFPRAACDEAALVRRLRAVAARVEPGRWNTRFTLLNSGLHSISEDDECRNNPPLIVEVVRAYGRDLDATLARFDIALAAVGVAFEDGRAVETVVHPLAAESVERCELLLLPAATEDGAARALSSAERLLRYARELRWARPDAQLEALRRAFVDATSGDDRSDARRRMLAAYAQVTQTPADCTAVRRLCGIGDDEWHAAASEEAANGC